MNDLNTSKPEPIFIHVEPLVRTLEFPAPRVTVTPPSEQKPPSPLDLFIKAGKFLGAAVGFYKFGKFLGDHFLRLFPRSPAARSL